MWNEWARVALRSNGLNTRHSGVLSFCQTGSQVLPDCFTTHWNPPRAMLARSHSHSQRYKRMLYVYLEAILERPAFIRRCLYLYGLELSVESSGFWPRRLVFIYDEFKRMSCSEGHHQTRGRCDDGETSRNASPPPRHVRYDNAFKHRPLSKYSAAHIPPRFRFFTWQNRRMAGPKAVYPLYPARWTTR